ncbi:MAG TPA: DegT/DnrJ/EryC1/StrS family aminotransferase [Candidatus Binataceae bacterium]|nr:DegT/DnrJ/EryC1/StrS family aminotransferase [Candidatus Binataceae bacterium]
MRIKFIDLASQNVEIGERVERELVRIHLETGYVGGPQVQAFEEEFAAFLGVRHVVSVGSGTDALRLALLAVGVGPGAEVITTPMTFIATAAAIRQAGARPTLVDVDPETCNISPHALRRFLEERHRRSPHGPRVIVPVHLYGLPAAMREIQEIALEFGMRIVEDACQAHGASLHDGQRWRHAGTLGAAGCFSFYPGKNLGAWGDGGAVATDSDELAERVRMLRDHGRISHYAHQEYGYNSRLDALQAAVLRAKLERLSDWNRRRREIAEAYRELLGAADLALPVEPEGSASAYHLFAIRSPRRDAIRQALLGGNIECGIHYPVPLHLQPACRDLGYRPGDFPISEQIADTELSLPMHPHLTDSEVRRVAELVTETLEEVQPIFAGEHGRSPIISALPPDRDE